MRLTLLLAALLFASMPAHADLAKIRAAGALKVAVYDDFAPFSMKGGAGIDSDLAAALAKKLDLKLTLLPFPAGENLNDDLRNMVWKGHYLGYGPADVLLHVPIDLALSAANPQVKIFAPYHTETVRLVRNVQTIPTFNGLASVAGKRIGVEKISIGAMVLLGEENGRYRDDMKIFPSGTAALEQLKAGQLDAVLANRSEIESVLRDDPRFGDSDLPGAHRPRGSLDRPDPDADHGRRLRSGQWRPDRIPAPEPDAAIGPGPGRRRIPRRSRGDSHRRRSGRGRSGRPYRAASCAGRRRSRLPDHPVDRCFVTASQCRSDRSDDQPTVIQPAGSVESNTFCRIIWLPAPMSMTVSAPT